MLTRANTLLCLFSYNMGSTLKRCIVSTMAMCPGFDLAIIDDQSEDPETRSVIETYRSTFKYCLTSEGTKFGKKHGNLYKNIQTMCDLAQQEGYDYLFLIQDDMQFVRPLDASILQQYSALFDSDDTVLQVDPRFLRRGYEYDIVASPKAYRFPKGDPRRSYADVGILRLSILKSLDWKFRDSEAENKRVLADLGYQRLFPFAPIMMHVPFPVTFRDRKRKFSLLPLRRGDYEFHVLTPAQQAAMDQRDLSAIPYFRTFLRPKNMLLMRLFYALATDASALR